MGGSAVVLGITYGSAGPLDIQTIYDLNIMLIDQYEDLESIDYEKVSKWIKNKINSHINEYTCIYFRGVKVGYYRLVLGEDETEMDDFYVFPEYQCKGIGTFVLNQCITNSMNPVFLYVFRRNTRAIRLYQRMGFVTIETVGNTRLIMRYSG